MDAREALIRQLDLDADAVEMLDRVLATQAKINRRMEDLERLQDVRRADVLGLTVKGVTRYRLAKLLDLSQTTLANIVND
jgi:hypothetical protein